MSWKLRTEMLLGPEGLDRLEKARAVIVGVGGVGAAAAEMLVRAGVGHVLLVDSDTVGETNINRQLPALRSTVGRLKVEVLKERFMDINPELDIEVRAGYVNEESLDAGILPCSGISVVVDAIDTLSPKVALIQFCLKNNIPLVSSMGSGAKLDVSKIRVADISLTSECPLAHMLRKRLHKLGIREGFTAVFSVEKPMRESVVLEESANKKSQIGTISYMPSAFGCACAQAAIAEILKN